MIGALAAGFVFTRDTRLPNGATHDLLPCDVVSPIPVSVSIPACERSTPQSKHKRGTMARDAEPSEKGGPHRPVDRQVCWSLVLLFAQVTAAKGQPVPSSKTGTTLGRQPPGGLERASNGWWPVQRSEPQRSAS
jgi:hypothetical protein